MTHSLDSLLDPTEFDKHERYAPPNPADNHFKEKPEKREPDYYCLGRGRWDENSEFSGEWKYCYARAGAGTSHLGYGRCKRHGGATQAAENRYAALLNDSIGEKLAKFLLDPNPLDMRAELAAARAIFEDFIQRHEAITEAVLAWHASYDPKRRGLHDTPLYNIEAIAAVVNDIRALPPTAKIEDLQAVLEKGVTLAQEEWVRKRLVTDKEYRTDFKVEKPMKMLDISHAARLLKIVNDMVSAIIKHEREAFLSVFAVKMLIEAYGEQTRKVLGRHLRRMGVTELDVIEEVITDIGRAWERTPALETSIPRIVAERERQDEFLGARPSAKAKVRK